jgi:hypothetical protein
MLPKVEIYNFAPSSMTKLLLPAHDKLNRVDIPFILRTVPFGGRYQLCDI